MRSIVLVLLLALVLAPPVYAAKERTFIDEPDPMAIDGIEDGEGWKEGTTILPPWPKDGDLVEVMIDDPAARFKTYVDGKNISIGSDEVVRYTLVLESRTGTRNLSFEGLRCTPSGLYKIYAYGTNGRFEKVDNEWQSLHGRGHDKVRTDLHRHILCIPRTFRPRPKSEMTRAMRTRVPQDADTGFQTE